MRYIMFVLLFCLNVLAQETGPANSVMRVPAAGGKARMGTLDLTASGTVGSSVLGIANGGTNNSGTLTAGSVLFSSGTGVTQDNANLFWDDSANSLNLGSTVLFKIGTTFEFNTLDSLSRTQIWNHGASSILRLGASQADGDTSDALTEGASFYGGNIGGTQNTLNVGYARIKHNRFGLYSLTDGGSLNDYYFRVDPTSLFLRDNSAVKTFEVARTTGNTHALGTLGIGNAAPVASAVVEVTSTTKGVLDPRMTQAQRDAISSPATGLRVYNTDTNKNNFYNGSAWFEVGNPMTTGGDIIYGGSSGTATRLANGTSGQVLTSNGTTVAPSWETNPSAPDSSYEASNLSISATVAANALTVAIKTKSGSDASAGNPIKIGVRSPTITNGTYSQQNITGALSMVVSSGSTLGTTSGSKAIIFVYLIDNSGTWEVAISSQLLVESELFSSVAEGGAGGADSHSTLYSTTARTSRPIRLIGRLESTQTAAGTWASAISSVHVGDYASISTTKELSVFYTGAPPTGTLSGSYNLVTFGSVVLDLYGDYSSGVYTVRESGIYTISAGTSQNATYSTGNDATLGFDIDNSGTMYIDAVEHCNSSGTQLNPRFSVGGVVLLSGQTIRFKTFNSGTSPSFGSLSRNNYMSIVRTGGY